MNDTTDIQARLDRLSSLGRAALALSCEGFDAAEMRRCGERLSRPPGHGQLKPLTDGQRNLGNRYLRRLENAEGFEAQAREHGLFTGEAKYMAFFGNRIINTLRAEILSWGAGTWEELADKAAQGEMDRMTGLGKKGRARMLRVLIELMTAAELDAIDLSRAGARLIEALIPSDTVSKPPRFGVCESCGARHRITG